jgi:hypothetical protein
MSQGVSTQGNYPKPIFQGLATSSGGGKLVKGRRWSCRSPWGTKTGRGAHLDWGCNWPKLLNLRKGAVVTGKGERATLSLGGLRAQITMHTGMDLATSQVGPHWTLTQY